MNAQENLCINSIRTLSIDAVQKADSGHPGLPLGAAPMAFALWQDHLKFNPTAPQWWDRDRFVLSAGHGSMLIYSLLHVYGYDLSISDLQKFRQWGSKTPGHPEAFMTPGIEATTGPLGQGAANAVGMAMAERYLAGTYNRPGFALFDHYTYALVSDGDLMEGVSSEAASLAGQLKLGKLIYLYDSNDVTLDGPASLSFSVEDVGRRFEAYGWQVIRVEDGDEDLGALKQAIAKAKQETQKPSLIVVKTTIGYGSPNKQGKSSSHGSPLGKDEIALTKKQLGWTETAEFAVPAGAREMFGQGIARSREIFANWQKLWQSYREKFPDLATELELAFSQQLPPDWAAKIPEFKAGDDQATRVSAGKVLNAIAPQIRYFFGGDADLSCSTNTALKDLGSFTDVQPAGRNIHYGVREHAMASAANGMAYHGGVRTFTATFFCFSDYMRPALRLAAMNHLPVIHVWTHDSIGLGEDGPTHQPIEHLAAIRAIPNFTVIRPCDANEAAQAWKVALARKDGPTGIVLTRQKVPTLDRTRFASADLLQKGAYVISEATGGPAQGILIATGSEVSLAIRAQELLAKRGVNVRVVSMPSFELFAAQDAGYRESVLPATLTKRVSIEAGSSFGWGRWTGLQGAHVSMDRFGASAPDRFLFENFGFTPENIAQVFLSL